MSDQDSTTRKTGDAAYRAAKEAIAERNAAVRKEGKATRAAGERKAAERRHAADVKEEDYLRRHFA